MNDVFSTRLSDRDFKRVALLVGETVGIDLPAHKRSMVELRLAKRARLLGMADLDEYVEFAFDRGGASVEQVSLIDVLTTNKTSFFREGEHFDQLTGSVLPELRWMIPDLGDRHPLRVWSAGCSTGEEPYSIAMALTGYADANPPFDFTVRATDVSTTALQRAVRAVYAEEHACAIPVELRRKCLLRNKDHQSGLVRIAPEVRERVRFSRHNLFSGTPPMAEMFEVIFCRNVIIYFQPQNQVKVLTEMVKRLVPGGYLFIGHSETLHGMPLPLVRAGNTLYRKAEER